MVNLCEALQTSTEMQAVVSRVCREPSAFFKSQQRGEAELALEEKIEIAEKLLLTKPCIFLSRYQQYLSAMDLGCLCDFLSHIPTNPKDADEISFYLKQISNRKRNRKENSSDVSVSVKNRRYTAMRSLIADGVYFSDWQMRNRDPAMYEEMIGQFLTATERSASLSHGGEHTPSNMRLSTMLMDFYDKVKADAKLEKEVEFEKDSENDHTYHGIDAKVEKNYQRLRSVAKHHFGGINSEGMDDDDDESELESSDDEDNLKEEAPPIKPIQQSITAEEKSLLRNEFIQHMYMRFLQGADEDFDYRSVDNNMELDMIDQIGADAEDAYFDSEEANDSLNCEGNNDTDIDEWKYDYNDNNSVEEYMDVQNIMSDLLNRVKL